jgi:hypothetical protein
MIYLIYFKVEIGNYPNHLICFNFFDCFKSVDKCAYLFLFYYFLGWPILNFFHLMDVWLVDI